MPSLLLVNDSEQMRIVARQRRTHMPKWRGPTCNGSTRQVSACDRYRTPDETHHPGSQDPVVAIPRGHNDCHRYEAGQYQPRCCRYACAHGRTNDLIPQLIGILLRERDVVRQPLAKKVEAGVDLVNSAKHGRTRALNGHLGRFSPIISNTSPALPCSTALTEYIAMP